jgi:hypothetical protein
VGIYSIFTCVKDGNFFLIPYLRNGGHLAVAHRVTIHFIWALSEYLAGGGVLYFGKYGTYCLGNESA